MVQSSYGDLALNPASYYSSVAFGKSFDPFHPHFSHL